jgi:hypothetical protein
MENTKRYVGKDCSQGHGGERYKSNWRCVKCCQLKKQTAKKAKRAANPKKRGRPINPDKKPPTREVLRERERQYWNKPENKHKRQAKKAKNRAFRLQRTPNWLTKIDKWMIQEAYELAILRTKLTGFIWEVDHVIPLQGKLVSGLHTPYNLQVIPKLDNAKKSNKFFI